MGINYFRRDDRDLRFVLFEHLDMEKLLAYEAYQDFTVEDFGMMIDEALKVCREVLGPTLQDGDREGCTFDGVIFAWVASGRGGGAGGHNEDFTRPRRVKKAVDCRGQVAGGGTAVFCRNSHGDAKSVQKQPW